MGFTVNDDYLLISGYSDTWIKLVSRITFYYAKPTFGIQICKSINQTIDKSSTA
jgi:hypothetical protein